MSELGASYSLRPALPDESAELTDLALRSKAHWGYDEEFMLRCHEDLKVSREDCQTGMVVAAVNGGELAGFYALGGEAPRGLLSDLFVDPRYISKGVGKLLLRAALRHATELGFEDLEIHSDPHAEDFYLHMGARRIGEVPSGSIAGRTLPLLLLKVE